MNIDKAIKILEALASGCSPATGEVIPNNNILNDRDVIRALQFAIDSLRQEQTEKSTNIEIDESDIQNAIQLFKEQDRNPTANSLTGFFLSTRQFKNTAILSSKLYGKFKGAYTSGQLLDFFFQYLSEKQIAPKNKFRNDAYSQIDYFEKEKFNKLTENGIKQLKEKISEIGILKTENLSDYVVEARKTYPRAYENWSAKEIEILSKAIKYTNDLSLLADCFQRGKGSIEQAAKKIIFTTQSKVDKT
jgi:ribosomal protein S18